MTFKNRYYQDEAEFSIFDYFARGKTGNPILALPTGTGKSIIIANFLKKVFAYWPNQRIMMITHVKTLISQNAHKLLSVWPEAPLGVYSAGLNSRDMAHPLLFAGVQSLASIIKKSGAKFGHRDLIIIDECHLISPSESSMYQMVIAHLKETNPYLKVIGLSATPYRLKQGHLTDNGIFTDVCYDLCTMESFNRLIAEGYLCNLIPKQTATEINLTGVKMQNGDYNLKQLEAITDTEKMLYPACREMVELAHNRKHWLIFTSGISSADHTASILQSFGVTAASVHSKKPAKINAEIIKDLEAGNIQAVVNCGQLTTGYDFPAIDFIGVLRATSSPGLWIQICGRGLRPAEGKENCLVADFAGNTKRLGPINDPVLPKKPGQKTGDAPVKICPNCHVYNHSSARECIACGQPFLFTPKVYGEASTAELVKRDSEPVVEYFDVHKVLYTLHNKKNSPPSMKVTYFNNLQTFNEYVCFEHKGLPRTKAEHWWQQRHNSAVPMQTFKALKFVSQLRTPKKVRVWLNKTYPEVLNVEY